MALDLPRTLSPSKVVAFTNCPLAFRFSQIEHRPEPPSPHAVKGTLVHAALEGLFWHHSPGLRTPAAAHGELERCWEELQARRGVRRARTRPRRRSGLPGRRAAPGRQLLPPGGPQRGAGSGDRAGCRDGGRRHAPARHHRPPRRDGRRQSHRRGLQDGSGTVGALRARQHGRGPDLRAALCESLLGRAPTEVRLLYLRQPIAISTVASEQTIRGQRRRAVAVWSAIERACDAEDFRPHVGPLCNHCHFKTSCPAFAA